MGETVTAMLSALPHGVVTRTQNCIGVVTAGVTSVEALPPTGFEKSNTGP